MLTKVSGSRRARRFGWGVAWFALVTAPAHAVAQAGDAPSLQIDQTVEEEAPEEGATIIVTGSRIARGGFDTPTPVTVLGNERLERLAQTDIGEALNQIPSFRATQTPQTSNVNPNNIGGRFADLRGLGPQRTLVLVDGRRFPASTALNTVDLNLIPIALIGRTEVVTGGASAAYGSDAVAGVVNIILDNKLQGVRGNVQVGITERGDDEKFLVSLAGGTKLFGDSAHLIMGAEFSDSRGVAACYLREYCRVSPGTINNPTPGANGVPAILMVQNARAAGFTPGGLIVSPTPLAGIQFDANANPIPFNFGQYWSPTAVYMIGGDGTLPNAYFYGNAIAPEVNRYSLYAHMDFDIARSTKGFVDLSYGRVKGRSPSLLGIRGPVTIQRDNPFIPAAIRDIMTAQNIASFRLGREGVDFNRAMNNSTTGTLRAAIGFSGDFSSRWNWDVHYQFGNTDYDQSTEDAQIIANLARAVDVVNTPQGPACRINADANPANDDPRCAPMNLFGLNNWSRASADYVFTDSWQYNSFRQHVAVANLRGTPFSTWAGDVSIAAGGELRSDDVDGDNDPVSKVQGFFQGTTVKIAGKSKVVEGYVETVVPLLRDSALAKRFELNGAVRQTHYSFSGVGNPDSEFSATTWKLGAVLDTSFGMLVRVTRSRDIRAPNVSELYSTPTSNALVVGDPQNNVFVNVPTLVSANPNLQAEHADNWTAGVTFQPNFIPRLRLSVDYFNIAIDGAITRPGTQTVVNRCFAGASEFCQFVTRDAAGALTAVTNPLYNFAQLKIDGVDFELSYNLGLFGGRLDAQLLATYVSRYTTTDSGGTIDRAGQTGFPSGQIPGMPHWLADAVVTYSKGPASLTLQAHYIDSGYHDVTRVGPDSPAYNPTLPNSVNINRLKSYTYFNLAGDVKVGGGVKMFAAVENLFDVDPPSIHSGNYGTNAILFDPFGRRFRVGARFQF